MAKGIHTELTFEEAKEASLLSKGGYIKGESKNFNPQLGLFPYYIVSFLKDSQPDKWKNYPIITNKVLKKK